MNSTDSIEMNYKNKKVYRTTNNHTYQRNQNFYLGNRHNFGNNFSSYNVIGSSTAFSKNAFHSRTTRYNQHNRRDPFENYKEYHWHHSRRVRREPSPLNGSEEYTLRKIQETSDMIKRQLMSPECTPDDSNIKSHTERASESMNIKSTTAKTKFNKNNKESSLLKRKLERKAALRAKFNKNMAVEKAPDATYNVKEIHDQIMNHISKLNYGRRQNLINADSTCYDGALQQMYKQKSLELSKALREMSHQEKPEASEVVNSIIPDFAIKFEELPVHVIRELSSTFETLEKNIGNDGNTSPFHFFTYSIENEGLHETTLVQNSYQEYLPRSNIYQSSSHSELSSVQSVGDDRVLHVNTEDEDTLLVKKDYLIEDIIKTEAMDIIEIEDDANGPAYPFSTQIITSEPQKQGAVEDYISGETKNVQSNFTGLGTSPGPSETNAIIGTVRVSKNIFEDTNKQISFENENALNLDLHESQNYFNSNCNYNEMTPHVRISKNLFDKVDNYAPENHSTIHDTSPEDSDTGLANKLLNQRNKISSVGKQLDSLEINTEIRNNNTSFAEESDSFLNASTILDKSFDLNKSCSSRQLGIPLLDNACNEQQRKENSPKQFSKKGNNIHDLNVTCDSDNSAVLNAQQLKENQINNSQTEHLNKYFSVTIKKIQKPQNIAEAIKMMLEIDGEIEKMNKLRQSLLLNFSEDQNSHDSKLISPNSSTQKRKKKKSNSNAKKRKSVRNQSQQEDSYQEYNQDNRIENIVKDHVEKEKEENNDFQQKKASSEKFNQNNVQCIRNVVDLNANNLTGVPVICKVVRQENSLIIGTDNGRIVYCSLCSSERPVTVGISQHQISCLDTAFVGEERLVYAGTIAENKLRILQYKSSDNRRNIRLEDGIQTMQKEWSYIFIGGCRGYLTRYNYQKNKIEFEDKISEMALVDLKATREGPRKILIILFKDEFGNNQIHVRDAMSALHMRTIGDIDTINTLFVKDSSLFFSSNKKVLVYNYCDGQFINKFTVPSQGCITFLRKYGNLLLATTSDGIIYAYNFKDMRLVGSTNIECRLITLFIIFQDNVIFGSSSKTMKSVMIPEHMLSVRHMM